jgi:hypothetical protein
MSGKNPQLTPLQLRKQLLLAESELNRAQLESECLALRLEVQGFARRIRTVGCVVSVTTALVALLAAARRPAAAPVAQKSSWLQTLLQGAGLLATLWTTGHSRKAE